METLKFVKPPSVQRCTTRKFVMAVSNTLKLYHSTSSPYSRRVRIFMAEKGLDLTLVPVDLGKHEQHSDEYRIINPRQMVASNHLRPI
jgi:hypothetical protein